MMTLKEVQRSLEKLNNTVSYQQEELERLARAKSELESRLQDAGAEAERYERGILEDLSSEYQRTAQELSRFRMTAVGAARRVY